jgi:hypothetical protein
VSLQVYDDFGKAGYSLTDYNQKWMTPNGLGEMAVEDTRSFSGGRWMYTQIIREVPVPAERWHHLDIALSRHDAEAWVDYFLDHQLIAHVEKIGIPLDKQGVPFTGIYTSVGDGELVADQLDSVRFGHGLFSLLDAFPFQHPEAPDLSVSIPVGDASNRGAAGRARLFGQGAGGSFGNFTTLTITGPAGRSDIVSALAAARS